MLPLLPCIRSWECDKFLDTYRERESNVCQWWDEEVNMCKGIAIHNHRTFNLTPVHLDGSWNQGAAPMNFTNAFTVLLYKSWHPTISPCPPSLPSPPSSPCQDCRTWVTSSGLQSLPYLPSRPVLMMTCPNLEICIKNSHDIEENSDVLCFLHTKTAELGVHKLSYAPVQGIRSRA